MFAFEVHAKIQLYIVRTYEAFQVVFPICSCAELRLFPVAFSFKFPHTIKSTWKARDRGTQLLCLLLIYGYLSGIVQTN